MYWGTFNQDNYSIVGGDGGCRVGEVLAGTTSPMPDHKGFKLQQLSEIHPLHVIMMFPGEIYKLSMTLDELEQRVQENLKQQHAPRVPFQSLPPAPAQTPATEMSSSRDGLSPHRQLSQGSLAGNTQLSTVL